MSKRKSLPIVELDQRVRRADAARLLKEFFRAYIANDAAMMALLRDRIVSLKVRGLT